LIGSGRFLIGSERLSVRADRGMEPPRPGTNMETYGAYLEAIKRRLDSAFDENYLALRAEAESVHHRSLVAFGYTSQH
jgi:hypothetical protein